MTVTLGVGFSPLWSETTLPKLGLFVVLGWLSAFAIGRGLDLSVRSYGGRMPHKAWIHGLTLIVAVLVGFRLGLNWLLPAYWLLAVTLISVSIIDWNQHRIPNLVVKPAFGAGLASLLLAQSVEGRGSILLGLLGAAAFAGVLGLIHLVQPEGMGQGDVRLAGVLGLYLGFVSSSSFDTGWNLGLVLLLASLLGLLNASVSAWRSSTSGAKFRTTSVPFGPSLSVATALVLFALN